MNNLPMALAEQVSQQIRRELHHLSGFLSLSAAECLDPTQLVHLTRCTKSVREVTELVQDLMEAGAAEAFTPRWSAVEPEALVLGLYEWIAMLCENKGTKLHVAADVVPPCVETDPGLIEDALYRILEKRTRSARGISMATSWREGTLRIEIADTGEPIVTDRENTRSGWWLRLISERMLRAGGQVELASNTAGRVTLQLDFPAKEISPSPIRTPRTKPFAPLRRSASGEMSLLVAEDSDESFALVEAYVASAGHQVSRARDGAEAVQMFHQGHYDLVLMDVQMPAVDGYAATRKIREWETEQGWAHVPVVLLSAEKEQRLTRMGAAVGCSGYLTKPTSRDALLGALRHYGGCNSAPTAH